MESKGGIMYYEFECKNPEAHETLVWTTRRPMIDAHLPEYCEVCGEHATRLYSLPQVCMGEMVAEGFKRTDEPPDYAKPDNWHEKMARDMDNYKIVSTPTHTKRRMVQS